MIAGQKSVRNNIEDFLCPFTDMYITQGARGNFSHKGTCANDVRGAIPGVRYDYYAPCNCKCLKLYPESGQSMWQSLKPVRFANGRIDYATFMLAHDNNLSQNAWVGKVVNQGDKLGTMGDQGVATGVHCHIQISQSNDTSWTKKATISYKGKNYPIYGFNNEYDPDFCYFIDNTNIIEGMGGDWKVTSDVPVTENIYINIPEWIDQRAIFTLDTKEWFNCIKPKKFGGLSYKIYSFVDNGYFTEIETCDFGRCLIRVTEATPITSQPLYEHGNY